MYADTDLHSDSTVLAGEGVAVPDAVPFHDSEEGLLAGWSGDSSLPCARPARESCRALHHVSLLAELVDPAQGFQV
jgi:hypothetical protein